MTAPATPADLGLDIPVEAAARAGGGILRDTVRVSGANAKIYTELGLIYVAQKRLELAQLVVDRNA